MSLQSLRNLLDEGTRPGRLFGNLSKALILLSMGLFAWSTLPGLAVWEERVILAGETVIVAAFTFEYLLRVLTAASRRRYIFSFMGLIDLLAIAPFYFAAGSVSSASLRAIRLLQLIRVLKFSRFGNAGARLVRAFEIAREELTVFFLITLILLYLASCGIFVFEHHAQPERYASIFHSLWWAIATLTTVGYGDIYPVTVGGKLFTSTLLLLGIGVVAVPSGLISAAFTQARIEIEHAGLPDDLHGLLAQAMRQPKAVRRLLMRTRHHHLPFEDPRDNQILDAVLELAEQQHSVDIVAILEVLEQRHQIRPGHLDHDYLIAFVRRHAPRPGQNPA